MWHRNRVKTLLDEEEVEYETATHAEAFTARGVAAASRLSSREVAKAVLVRDGGGRFLDYLWAARPMLGQFCLHGEAARANA